MSSNSFAAALLTSVLLLMTSNPSPLAHAQTGLELYRTCILKCYDCVRNWQMFESQLCATHCHQTLGRRHLDLRDPAFCESYRVNMETGRTYGNTERWYPHSEDLPEWTGTGTYGAGREPYHSRAATKQCQEACDACSRRGVSLGLSPFWCQYRCLESQRIVVEC